MRVDDDIPRAGILESRCKSERVFSKRVCPVVSAVLRSVTRFFSLFPRQLVSATRLAEARAIEKQEEGKEEETKAGFPTRLVTSAFIKPRG